VSLDTRPSYLRCSKVERLRNGFTVRIIAKSSALTSNPNLSFSIVSRTFSIACSSTKSRNVFHNLLSAYRLILSLCLAVCLPICNPFRNVDDGLRLTDDDRAFDFVLSPSSSISSECWLPKRDESAELLWWKSGGTSWAPSDSRMLSNASECLTRSVSQA
jgi:hypothetical protein